MRIVTIILNIIVLLSAIIMGIMEGFFPFSGGEEIGYCLWIWLIVVTAIFSMINTSGSSWLSLYLERKSLEEKQRIEELNKSMNKDS